MERTAHRDTAIDEDLLARRSRRRTSIVVRPSWTLDNFLAIASIRSRSIGSDSLLEAFMFRRNYPLFLSAAVFATLAACHQAKPATSVTAPSYQDPQADVARPAAQDRSAREVPGYAPSPKASYELATESAARAPAPAPAPQDDPMRQFDMP